MGYLGEKAETDYRDMEKDYQSFLAFTEECRNAARN